MTSLNEYLAEKRAAVAARETRIEAGSLGTVPLSAEVSVEGRSGVRRIRIRDHQVVTDSPPDFAGYNLGPGSPELQLGILGSCLAHSYLIQAARLGVPLDAVVAAAASRRCRCTRMTWPTPYGSSRRPPARRWPALRPRSIAPARSSTSCARRRPCAAPSTTARPTRLRKPPDALTPAEAFPTAPGR